MNAPPGMISFRQLAAETGAARDAIRPWLEAEGISCAKGVAPEDKERALKIIDGHRQKNRAPKPKIDPADQEANGKDPKTGLSWFQANLMEQTMERRRQNRLAEKQENEEWMATVTHHQILGELCGRLEQVPGKCKAELGLSDLQCERIRKMLDEIRQDSATAVGKMEISNNAEDRHKENEGNEA